MKKSIAVVMTLAMVASMSLGVYAEELTGTAQGFGGDITVSLTMDGETITAVNIDGAGETPTIGGAALEELGNQVVAANGPEIEGVSGATFTSLGVKNAVAAALGVEAEAEEEEAAEEEAPAEEAVESVPAEIVPIEGGLQLGMIYGAAHGTRCFTVAYAVVQDDTVVAAYVDDFQFMAAEDYVGVPNSDSDFAEGYAEGVVLASKLTNVDAYSQSMAEKAGATNRYDDNMNSVISYAIGKTIDELDAAAGDENIIDAVSGSTLADTAGYLKAIADAGRAAKETQAVEFSGSSEDLTLSVKYGAAHGTRCFTLAATLTDGENVLLSLIDDLQFMSPEEYVGVPNSDSDFAEGYAEGVVLASKRVNADAYSQSMAEKANATNRYDDNLNAIQAAVNGTPIADVAAIDEVSGSTLADTANYVELLAETAAN